MVEDIMSNIVALLAKKLPSQSHSVRLSCCVQQIQHLSFEIDKACLRGERKVTLSKKQYTPLAHQVLEHAGYSSVLEHADNWVISW